MKYGAMRGHSAWRRKNEPRHYRERRLICGGIRIGPPRSIYNRDLQSGIMDIHNLLVKVRVGRLFSKSL